MCTDEESNRGMADVDLQEEENLVEDLDKYDTQFKVWPRSQELEKEGSKKEGERSLSHCVSNCHEKQLKIRIPLTNPTRAFSYLLWEDLINQSSKKQNAQGKKLHINKTKLHHAEKMIRGALIELYKGLGYLKTYRYIFCWPC